MFGYSPTVAGRFAGLGNLGYAQLAAGAVLLAGLLAYRIGGRRGALIAIALLGVAIVVDGAPFFGSDVGGVLSMVPAYAITATLLLGWRVRWKLVALYGAATHRAARDLRGDRPDPAGRASARTSAAWSRRARGRAASTASRR